VDGQGGSQLPLKAMFTFLGLMSPGVSWAFTPLLFVMQRTGGGFVCKACGPLPIVATAGVCLAPRLGLADAWVRGRALFSLFSTVMPSIGLCYVLF
jgi:hypothetical protein